MKYKIFEDVKSELRKYNVESVAEIAQVASATLYFWLEGKTKKPRIDTITKVAEAMGMELRLEQTKIKHLKIVGRAR